MPFSAFYSYGGSWINRVERWFTEIIRRQIRRGTFCSVKAIHDYID